jgi:CRISPR system Cascade subunit CasC
MAKAYKEKGEIKKAINKLKPEDLKDAADISLFGRMVASDHSLTIEGASMFNHALSTHKVENEIDYFSAMEDWPTDDAGAAMTSTLEFNSATYYRFAALNLDMLFDEDHLVCLESTERKEVVKAFVRATLQALPIARRNSMNGNVPPSYVLCVLREKGHPIQLINAFEEPVQSKNGIVKKSIEALEKEYKGLKETWGLGGNELRMPEKNLNALLKEVEKHVN